MVVTVAPAVPIGGGAYRQYEGQADYYCTGVDDQLIINSAIKYLSGAYGGGTVQLLEGTFNTTSPIILLSKITINGTGDGCIVTTSTSNINIIDISGFNNVKISNISVINLGGGYCISTTLGYYTTIDSCSLMATNSGTTSGIYSTNSNSIIRNNKISYCHWGIEVAASSYSIITGNQIQYCGSGIDGLFSYCSITDNVITNGTLAGISIASGSTFVKVTGNYCYNNNTDTGIANNGWNFVDVGTDTQVYSNSWQSPVAGEPSLGTLHWLTNPTTGNIINSSAVADGAFATYNASSIVPAGTKGVFVSGDSTVTTGGGAAHAYSWISLRATGSAVTDLNQNRVGFCRMQNCPAATILQGASISMVALNSSRQFDAAKLGLGGTYSYNLTVIGYFI